MHRDPNKSMSGLKKLGWFILSGNKCKVSRKIADKVLDALE